MGILAQVIGKVGTDRKAIRDALAAINSEEKAYQGVTGATYFDKNGDCIKPAIVSVVKDGKFVRATKQLSEVEAMKSSGGDEKAVPKKANEPKKEGGNGLLYGIIAVVVLVVIVFVAKKPKS